jgi:arylsulfatase A-like enzyme
MLEAMDFHIGRYMRYLSKSGKLENTVFIITSDNGPEALDPALYNGMGLWLKLVGYNRDYETLGEKKSWNFIGPEFASAAASPNSFFKFYAGEGGLRVPLIISGANIPKGQKKDAFSFVTDVTPTILDLANVKYAPPLSKSYTGKTLQPYIQNQSDYVYEENDVIGVEAAGHAALFKGNMKITRNGPLYGDFKWRLYNLKDDPGETKDLSKSSPEMFKDLLAAYQTYTSENNVLEMAEDYDLTKEAGLKFKVKILKKVLIFVAGIGVLLIFFYRRKNRRSRKNYAV